MIFLANADGSFASVLPESVYQGANKANEIVFIAPFARGNIVTVAYTLPNGINTQEYVLTSDNTVLTGVFEGLNVWKGELDKTITQYSGVVTAQFFVSTGNDVEVATYSQEFTVNKGVPTNGQIISSSTLTQLKDLMAQINNRNNQLDDDINGTNGLKTKVTNNTEKITENTDAINNLTKKLSDIETEANDSFNPSNGSFNSSYTGQQIENSVKAISETVPNNGIEVTANDGLSIVQATNNEIDDATNDKKPITPANAKYAIKKGLTEPKSTWSQEEQRKARETLGVGQNGETIVVGNPNAEPNEELKTIQIGATIYELPEGIKKVAGAIPLSTTPGVKGDMCYNTTYNQFYVCIGGTTNNYAWIKIPLLTDTYIAKPNSLEPGLVKLGSTDNGLTLTASNNLVLRAGTKKDVENQSAFRLPVMMNMIGYAVKQGLINPEKAPVGSGFREAWEVNEQALARRTLGIKDVVANPSGTAIGSLVKIQIGNTVYSIPSGSLPEGFNPEDYATITYVDYAIDNAIDNAGITTIYRHVIMIDEFSEVEMVDRIGEYIVSYFSPSPTNLVEVDNEAQKLMIPASGLSSVIGNVYCEIAGEITTVGANSNGDFIIAEGAFYGGISSIIRMV